MGENAIALFVLVSIVSSKITVTSHSLKQSMVYVITIGIIGYNSSQSLPFHMQLMLLDVTEQGKVKKMQSFMTRFIYLL